MMNKTSWGVLLTAGQKLAWVLFLVFLPVTSFPFFPPALGGGALVRPLSIYPLILLLALVTLPRLVRGPLPKTLFPLLAFVIIAAASSLLSLLRGVEPRLGVSVISRLLRAWVTLGLGGAIYLTVSLLPLTREDLRSSLRWLYAGFSLALLWGSAQAIYVLHFSQPYYHLLNRIQDYISTRRLFTTRVSGLTYEPNWFGEQISFLLMPWLLSSVLTGNSVFRWRWRWLTVEWLLLGWSVGVLAFTFSRAGLIVLVALIFIGLLFFRPHKAQAERRKKSLLHGWTLRLAEAGLVILVLAGFFYYAGSNNEFFSRIWSYWSDFQNKTLSGYFEYLGFGARFTYGETALRTYEAYPAFGVGLGIYAFYFEDMLPDRPLATMPEVLRIITPDVGRDRLITTKNLYLRLLAETGLIGAAAFLAFVVAILGCALSLLRSAERARRGSPVIMKEPAQTRPGVGVNMNPPSGRAQPGIDREERYWGIAGVLGLVAFVLSAVSFDSFAIPNMWVVFGLVTAAFSIFARPVEARVEAPETAAAPRMVELSKATFISSSGSNPGAPGKD